MIDDIKTDAEKRGLTYDTTGGYKNSRYADVVVVMEIHQVSYEEAKILDEWAKEYNVPQHHPAEVGSGQHFPGRNHMDHTHIYNIHVPYEYR